MPLLYLVIALLLLGVFSAIIGWYSSHRHGDTPIAQPSASCATCTGDNDRCEQECMMAAATRPIEYFDDEELDIFANRPSDNYTDNEVELFAEVLHTMRQDEVAAWCRSLHLRQINLPNQLKDEVFMLIG